MPKSSQPFVEFPDFEAWTAWLANHAITVKEIWLRIGKSGSREELIGIEQAGDGALCYGWIDSQRMGYDKGSYLQRYSPRRPGSPWSKRNTDRAEALVTAGLVQASGLQEIGKAQADGRWQAAYEPQAEFQLPSELEAALANNPSARLAFDRLTKTRRYALVLPILKALSLERRQILVARLVKDFSPKNWSLLNSW